MKKIFFKSKNKKKIIYFSTLSIFTKTTKHMQTKLNHFKFAVFNVQQYVTRKNNDKNDYTGLKLFFFFSFILSLLSRSLPLSPHIGNSNRFKNKFFFLFDSITFFPFIFFFFLLVLHKKNADIWQQQ